MATASAPGKVYLFGEHAVVYGEPAVPCAIRRRVRATVERRADGLCVHAPDLALDGVTVGADDRSVAVSDERAETALRYVTAAIDSARESARAAGIDAATGFDVTVEGTIPPGAGLGSSAALVVATLAAAADELGVALSRERIADRAYRVERTVQGEASRADTFCSTMGGAVRVEGEDCRTLAAPALPLVVGYDGGGGDTGALVAEVRRLREEYDFAAETVGAIGDLVRRGEDALAAGDHAALGQLMNSNHGLLSALGVSARSLDAMVWAAREAGARGAKLTGAGGGGCIVALDETPATVAALEQVSDCEQAFRAELDDDGLRVDE
jgi:mevalonate kinase